jgi:hypothetical protein
MKLLDMLLIPPLFLLVVIGSTMAMALVVGVSWLTTAVQRLLIRGGLLCPHARLAPCRACILEKVQARLGYVPLDVAQALRACGRRGDACR